MKNKHKKKKSVKRKPKPAEKHLDLNSVDPALKEKLVELTQIFHESVEEAGKAFGLTLCTRVSFGVESTSSKTDKGDLNVE